jgi:HPt (histidine-containing phosphotransfer) domain-containing protein
MLMTDILDLDSALEYVGGEKELLEELLIAFVNDKKLDQEELTRLEKTDKNEAAKYVHYFKGAGRQLCAGKLNHSGQKLEDFLRNRLPESAVLNLDELNQDFIEAYEQTLQEIKKFLKM